MLFGNNMSWLYGKLKKKLDAPATAGSAGDVLTLGESGKPEWDEGGGGALPEVTSVDEGKVLTVVDNDGTYEWEAAEPAGGGGYLVVKGAGEIASEAGPDNTIVYTIAADHSDDDIIAAYKNFVPVYIYIPDLRFSAEHMYDNGAVHIFLLNNKLYEDDFAMEQTNSCGYYLDDGVFYLFHVVDNQT